MQTQIFNFPVIEFCWYGIVSIMSLVCFASLSYEVKRALDATAQTGSEPAREVVLATYNVNFMIMVVANIALILSCIGILAAGGDAWRAGFAASIFICGAYWFYTRACEEKLILFLQSAGVYPQSARPALRLKLFHRTS